MTSQEAFKFKCAPGMWLVNIAKVDEPQNWVEQPLPHDQTGKLFGYDEKEFMRRQYK